MSYGTYCFERLGLAYHGSNEGFYVKVQLNGRLLVKASADSQEVFFCCSADAIGQMLARAICELDDMVVGKPKYYASWHIDANTEVFLLNT